MEVFISVGLICVRLLHKKETELDNICGDFILLLSNTNCTNLTN